MLTTSGMRKLVRAPASMAGPLQGQGSPRAMRPTSVVVPPMSHTMASEQPLRKAAPRRELTGPLWKVAIGICIQHIAATSSKLLATWTIGYILPGTARVPLQQFQLYKRWVASSASYNTPVNTSEPNLFRDSFNHFPVHMNELTSMAA